MSTWLTDILNGHQFLPAFRFLGGNGSKNGHNADGSELKVNFDYSRLLLGLSGAGREGSSHIGVLKFMDEQGIIPSIESKIPFEGVAISSGAMALAGYMAQRLILSCYPHEARHTSPSYKLEEILKRNTDMYQLLSKWEVLTKNKEGFVNPERLERFFKELVGDMIFRDVPGLYIVVHNLATGQDVIYGQVGHDTLIRDALRQTVTIPGMIEHVKHKEN